LLSKSYIREIEEEVASISESAFNMNQIQKFSLYLLYSQAKKQLLLQSFSCMLDVGCGDGLFLDEIADTLKQKAEYVGVDMSLRKLRLAKNKSRQNGISGNSHFVLADAEYLPFNSSVFPVVTMIEVFEHFLNPSVIIDELARVVVGSGKIVITTPSAYGLKGSKKSILKRFLNPKIIEDPKLREAYIIIEGKKLPHRDFTVAEIRSFISPNFTELCLCSFNFGMLLLIGHVLPTRLTLFFLLCIENQASKLPITWGGNLLVSIEKTC
jgi:ubiquinone/menaquinone biosynthesis C-methylase UbiE